MDNPADSTATPQHEAAESGLTLAQYAEAKQLPLRELLEHGLGDLHYAGKRAVRMPYWGTDGTSGPVRFRIARSGDKFRWKVGAKPTLYGLWRLNRPDEGDSIVLVEGESDWHTLAHYDIPCLALPGANAWNEERDAAHFEPFQRIYVVIEPDTGGAALLRWLATSRIRERVWVVQLGHFKDVSGLHLAEPDLFHERWQAALAAAIPWSELAASEVQDAQAAAWARCGELAYEPNILARFADELHRTGLAGEQRTAMLLYLCLTGRLLDRPPSVAIKGPSSAGKSHLVERVLDYFPASAFFTLTAMSERALAYSQEPLQHRFLVLYEAAGLTGEMATYLIRSLLSEGRLRYETVEKTPAGLRPRLIEREGPTGLIVTTTALHLHPENETRMLTLTVTDTPEQTQAVMRALANEARPVADLDRWQALQTWLEGAERRVSIPYGPALAELIPPVSVRLRRDFGALLNLVRACAILHQATRERDADGRIVASLDDYAIVRELAADLLADGVEATVPVTVRETVTAVQQINQAMLGIQQPASLTEVARQLNLDKGPTSRRVRAAEERGYLKNLENKRGKPARLVLGEPLPPDQPILPSVERLKAAVKCCRVAGDPGGIVAPPSSATDCPRCGERLTGSTCWDCLDRLCSACGRFTGTVSRPLCERCQPAGASPSFQHPAYRGTGQTTQ